MARTILSASHPPWDSSTEDVDAAFGLDTVHLMESKAKQGRPNNFIVQALNITTHPHSPQLYADRFLAAFKRQESQANPYFSLGRDRAGKISTCASIVPGEPVKGIEGLIISFVEISAKEPWFNLAKAEEADQDQLAGLNIPSHLRPRLISTRYIFLPEIHKFFWISSMWNSHLRKRVVFSPPTTAKLIWAFLNQAELLAENEGEAEVQELASHEALERIFDIPVLEELAIEYARPNPDGDDDMASAVAAELESQGIGKVDSRFKAVRNGSGIHPGGTLRGLARLAAIEGNGSVVGKGTDEEGRRVVESTADSPRSWAFRERSKSLGIIEWFRSKVRDIADGLR